MYQDYKDLLCAFHARGVRYLIVETNQPQERKENGGPRQ
jgi:hypothetical protein